MRKGYYYLKLTPISNIFPIPHNFRWERDGDYTSDSLKFYPQDVLRGDLLEALYGEKK